MRRPYPPRASSRLTADEIHRACDIEQDVPPELRDRMTSEEHAELLRYRLWLGQRRWVGLDELTFEEKRGPAR